MVPSVAQPERELAGRLSPGPGGKVTPGATMGWAIWRARRAD